MPLSMMSLGTSHLIRKLSGTGEVKCFLEKMGFVPGERVSVVSDHGGNLIVSIKQSRVALGRDLALKIIV